MPSRAVVLAVSFLALILFAAAACNDESSDPTEAEATTDDAGGTSASETAVTEGEQAETEAEAVSELCRAAMTRYHDALITLKNPNAGPLEVATLKACKSRGEWLAAVQPYADEGQGCPIACLEPETVYRAICGGNENLPACRE